jgi:hypothetical protein
MKKYNYFILLFCLVLIPLEIYGYSTQEVYSYIERYRGIALSNEKEFGIPASIILAQGILESGAGTSSLTRSSNNHFGIKTGGSGWKGRVYRAWDDESVKSRFRCYDSAEASFRDHARVLTTVRNYRPLFSISVYDYRGWAYGLKKAGYATHPKYAESLIGIIEHYRLYAINGGVKLRPGKTVVITKYKEVEKPVFEDEYIMPEEEMSEEETIITEAIALYVSEINEIHCTVIQPGEDLSSIAKRYDISPAELLKYNELASSKYIKIGDIIFLDKKKKKYLGSRDFYITKEGETLYDVSQKFGMQLKELAKLNGLNAYASIDEGTNIYLK